METPISCPNFERAGQSPSAPLSDAEVALRLEEVLEFAELLPHINHSPPPPIFPVRRP